MARNRNDDRGGRHDDEDYEVGRNRPPEDTRFRKGKSGNPKGRPKGSLNIKTGLMAVLSKTVSIRENGKNKRIPRHQAMFLRNVAQAIEGDPRAYANVLKTIDKYLPEDVKTESQAEPSEALQLAYENHRKRLREELREELEEEIRTEILAEMEERTRRGRPS